MFYALSSIGSFTDGARKRQQEIRNERTAIREEFERWKANNPYATAMDFHAKVKQLGATSPGGNVALPDSASIQRMAAENLRRKQEEEAEKERRRRIQDMDMKIKETTYARQLLMDNPNMSASQLLNSMGMPTTGATLEWAEGLQQKMKTELEQAQADRARKLEQEERVLRVQRQTYVDDAMARDPLLPRSEAEAMGDRLFGPLSSSYSSPASSYSSPTTSYSSSPAASSRPTTSQTYGPTQPASARPAPSQAPMSGDDQGRVSHIQRYFDNQLAAATSPEEARAIIVATSQRAMAQHGYTEDQIKTALSQSQVYADKTSEFRTMAFDTQLEEAQDISQLTAVVSGATKKIRYQDVPLKAMAESAFNNTNFIDNAYIPKGMETEVAKKLATYFVIDEAGNAVLRPDVASMDSGERVAMIRADLEPYGVAPKDEIQANRASAIAMAPAITSVQDYVDVLAGDGDFSYPIDKTLAEITENYETKAEKDALKQVLLNRIDAEIATLASGDSVAIYGAGFVDIRDVLPPGADADMAPLEQWFRDTRQKILDFDTTAGTITDGEKNQVEAEGQRLDRAMAAASEPVGDDAVNGAIEALGGFGINQGLGRGITLDSDGNFSRELIPNTKLSEVLLQGSTPAKQAVVQAMATAFEAFEAQRGTGLQYEVPKNRKGLMSIIAGFVQTEISGVKQAMSQYPGYNRGIDDAREQFKTTLEVTAGTSGLSSKDIDKLVENFDVYIRQVTRQNRFIAETGPRNQNVTRTDLLNPAPAGLPPGARLYQAN